jgi:hypothetical protein
MRVKILSPSPNLTQMRTLFPMIKANKVSNIIIKLTTLINQGIEIPRKYVFGHLSRCALYNP